MSPAHTHLTEFMGKVEAGLRAPTVSAPDLTALLRLALPYVEAEASKSPTEPRRIERKLKAGKDAAAIRAALAAVTA